LMTPDDARPDHAWTIIIPVKDTRVAKTRLTGLSQPVRAALALAFAQDTVTAALACADVREVVGVTSVRRTDPQAAVAAMSADLPALRSEDLHTALVAGSAHLRWFVADAEGAGTTLLAARRGLALRPAFGAGSRQAHALRGATDLVGPDLERLRRDVDTEEHLWQAVGLGVGHHTLEALAELALVCAPLA
jgi:2-phospho-L-lactate guanylyltransferase